MTRFFSRARTTDQRGFALIAAIALAVVYFALIELLMIDASRELSEARRFKSRIVAATLAENAAELAAAQITTPGSAFATADAENWQGKMSATLKKSSAGDFEIEAKGTATGVAAAKARVTVIGKVVGNGVQLYYTMHQP